MNKSITRLLAAAVLSLMLAGCITIWSRIDQPRLADPQKHFTVEVPTDWVQFSFNRESLQITRDGLQIQSIEAGMLNADQFFKRTKKTLPATALPSEAAALVLAELRAGLGNAELTVLQNVPAMVAGQPGFRVHAQFRNDRGALFDMVMNGTVVDGKLLLFSYRALDTYYFKRDLPVFEKVVSSYRKA